MPEVVDSEPLGKASALDCRVPDLPSEVGVAKRLTPRRGEDQRIGIVVDVSEEVLGHEFAAASVSSLSSVDEVAVMMAPSRAGSVRKFTSASQTAVSMGSAWSHRTFFQSQLSSGARPVSFRLHR